MTFPLTNQKNVLKYNYRGKTDQEKRCTYCQFDMRFLQGHVAGMCITCVCAEDVRREYNESFE